MIKLDKKVSYYAKEDAFLDVSTLYKGSIFEKRDLPIVNYDIDTKLFHKLNTNNKDFDNVYQKYMKCIMKGTGNHFSKNIYYVPG